MELISYEQLGRLRLRDFAPEGVTIDEASDWQWMGSCWINEGIGFTSFSRHVSTPDETGGVEIDFSEMPANSNQRLLNALRLPLRAGMGTSDVLSVLGGPKDVRQYRPGSRTYEFAVGSAQSYFVDCTVEDAAGLVHIAVIRQDLVPDDEQLI